MKLLLNATLTLFTLNTKEKVLPKDEEIDHKQSMKSFTPRSLAQIQTKLAVTKESLLPDEMLHVK